MNNKNKYLKFLINYAISMICIAIVVVLVFLGLYDFEYSNIHISNSFFIPSILVFIISIGVNLGADNIFSAFKYTAAKFFNRQKTNETYRDFSDYVEQKNREIKNYWYVSLAALTMIGIAFIFSIL